MNTVNINGKEKDLVWVDRQGNWDGHHEVDGVPFDGHRILWSFEFKPHTYLKESELSGDEWRKGGTIKIFKDGVQVWEEFCREPLNAASRMWSILVKCMDFNWEYLEVGRKVYYRDQPAIITDILMNQGCVIMYPEGKEEWDSDANDQEDLKEGNQPDDTWRKSVKTEFFDPHIHWWRK